jgi:hypothetical protein
MYFTEAANWLWALAVIGGPLLLGLAYGCVLMLRRRHRRAEVSARALQPARDARASGRALHPEDMVSLVAGSGGVKFARLAPCSSRINRSRNLVVRLTMAATGRDQR